MLAEFSFFINNETVAFQDFSIVTGEETQVLLEARDSLGLLGERAYGIAGILEVSKIFRSTYIFS